MKHKQAVKISRLSAYEQAVILNVQFIVTDSAIKGIEIQTSIGPLSIALESYSIAAYEPAMRDVYRATVTDSRGQVPDFFKDFYSENERDIYARNFERDDERFNVAVSEFQEPAV